RVVADEPVGDVGDFGGNRQVERQLFAAEFGRRDIVVEERQEMADLGVARPVEELHGDATRHASLLDLHEENLAQAVVCRRKPIDHFPRERYPILTSSLAVLAADDARVLTSTDEADLFQPTAVVRRVEQA